MSVLCSVSERIERIHGYPPEEQRKFPFPLFKNIKKSKSTLITQASSILQMSCYTILLICTWKLAFMEEWKRPAGKGAEWGAIIILHLYLHLCILADDFIQSDFIQVIIFLCYMCSLGIEPTTFCAANAMLYHWATGTIGAILSRLFDGSIISRPKSKLNFN